MSNVSTTCLYFREVGTACLQGHIDVCILSSSVGVRTIQQSKTTGGHGFLRKVTHHAERMKVTLATAL